MPLEGYISADGPYTGLTKDQLLECAYRPAWVRVRYMLLIAYWVGWATMLAAAITLIAMTPKCSTPKPLQWWQLSPVYQVYPLSYQDSNQPPDGVGDIRGIESRLDYIKDLGVGAIWLSPIYKSPMKDFGYDVEDFRAIAPVFGTMEDFRSLSEALKERGLKLVMDFIPNHSSNLHKWFQRSIKKQDPYTHYYVWADAKGFESDGKPVPPNNWMSVFGGSAWEWNEDRRQYYLHQFLKEQPDLNYANPLVLQEMKDVLRFWLDEGVDGFRMDAVAHLFEDEELRDEPINEEGTSEDEDAIVAYQDLDHIYTYNLPQVLEVLREFRILLDEYSNTETKIMMTEAYMPVRNLMEYYGNKSTPIAHFPFNFEFIELKKKNLTAESVHNVIKSWMDNLPNGAWPNWVIGNHDNSRVATRFGSELVDAINMIILLLPGTPVTYNGEEIGMEDTAVSWEETKDTFGINAGPVNYKKVSRDPERTPIQWTAGKNAGFSNANRTWLPVNPNYPKLNVEAQLDATWSHLRVYKLLTQARKEEAVMNGKLDVQVLDKKVLAFTRVKEGFPGYLVVVNFLDDKVTVDLTTLRHVPEESTVYTFSTTYATNFTMKKRIANSAVVLPGKGGLVLTFVPEFQETSIPL
ncbi:hypothetical protein ANN_16779 [Periplaneta americana]|uniref:alpha-glucosidase n=1 Tax=Periplaneta americana TaxID=6978 RepID=A0ABQ8SR18_PERAM|nr:hypothetical protein ANN_16779 [Periplaneta americana]